MVFLHITRFQSEAEAGVADIPRPSLIFPSTRQIRAPVRNGEQTLQNVARLSVRLIPHLISKGAIQSNFNSRIFPKKGNDDRRALT